MQLFYAPVIEFPRHTLGEEESKHCLRVLRLAEGDTVHLTDGRGNLFTGVIADADPRRCAIDIVETVCEYGRRGYSLTMAVAPTKNIERYEWFLEKATEVGCDVFIPVECARSERRIIKAEREKKVITSAVKQSLKAYHPLMENLTPFKEVVMRGGNAKKLIAHCGKPIERKGYISEYVGKGDDVVILIGPEGDFSPEEITFAVENGFSEISLGDSRLRTETAALSAVLEVALINR